MRASIRPSRNDRINAGLLIGFGSALTALLTLALLAQSVGAGATQELDDSLRFSIHQHAVPALTAAMHFVTAFGAWPFYLSAMLVLVAVFVAARWVRAARLLIITMAGSALLDTSLKLLFRRARPTPFFGLAMPDTYSFPSGHALSALCFYGITASILAARFRSRTLRAVVWISAAILIFAVGFSRIYLGVHYPSDVIAGYAAALIWVTVVTLADRFLQARGRREQPV